MNIALRGSSPVTLAAGILLLSHARRFGERVQVEIVGDPTDLGRVLGPAILHSPSVASCGVGRELGHGSLVVVPGPMRAPLAVSLSADGRDGWFYVDRIGDGVHPATREVVSLLRSKAPAARRLGRAVLDALDLLGIAAEPAVFDLLFGAPAPPLTRVSLAMRAGRALAGARGRPINEILSATAAERYDDGALPFELALGRLVPAVRVRVAAFVREAEALTEAEGGPPTAFLEAFAELLGHLTLLPRQVMLPPLDPAMDAVAYGLGRALAATGPDCEAQEALLQTYRFLGGKFTTTAEHAVMLPGDAPPDEPLARWAWFCSHVAMAAESAEKLWRDLVDPPM